MKAAPEQLDLGLGLVVPVAAAPGPGVARGRLFGNDDDTALLSLRRVLDSNCSFCRAKRLNLECRFIHEVVVAVKAIVPGRLLALKRLIEVIGRGSGGVRSAGPEMRMKHRNSWLAGC